VVGASLSIGDDMEDIAKRYKSYIHSHAWYGTREVIFQEKGTECKYCLERGVHKRATHIHHAGYETYGTKDYKLSLFPLCRECHEAIHGVDSEGKGKFIWFGGKVVRVQEIPCGDMEWISDYSSNPEYIFFRKIRGKK